MHKHADANWWSFTIEAQARSNKIAAGLGGPQEVNPALPDGRHLLDYHTYIGLEQLLSCQAPSSMVPDERCFIITHQLFELVFKLMIFDLAVAVETLAKVLAVADDRRFIALCTSAEGDAFWTPALTASARVKYSSQEMLARLMAYLGNVKGFEKDETFNSLEFGRFRKYLPPASGFQSAQFRLIQRAFGKANLLDMRLFPSDQYSKEYENQPSRGPVKVVDPLILRDDVQVAEPPENTPLAQAARLDEVAHQMLARLGRALGLSGSQDEQKPPRIRKIQPDEVENAVTSFRNFLDGHRKEQERLVMKPLDADEADRCAVAVLRQDLEAMAQKENSRREDLEAARFGAFRLHCLAPRSCLAQVLNHLIAADEAIHSDKRKSFIGLHYAIAASHEGKLKEHARKINQPEPISGTGGGGVKYLAYSRARLIPLFPALIAYHDLEDSPQLSWVG